MYIRIVFILSGATYRSFPQIQLSNMNPSSVNQLHGTILQIQVRHPVVNVDLRN